MRLSVPTHASRLMLLLFAAILTATGCRQALRDCAANDKNCAAKAAQNHVAKQFSYWTGAFAKPLDQRIGPAPAELVEYINLDNIANGFPDKPVAAQVSPEFLAEVRDAFAEIPDTVRRRLSGKLAGIYFVHNLGGTGYTEQIFDANGLPIAGFTVLDAAVLEQRTANMWATWKENTPFKPQTGYSLTAEIEEARHDTRKYAIQYILLHELGHVLAIDGKFHPSWDAQPRDYARDKNYPFFDLSWTVSWTDNRYYTLFDASFPHRADVIFYFGAKLTGDQMADTYEHLEHTNFATLYSLNNPSDDFAEAFANYVHVVLMHKPYRITIAANGNNLKVYDACWAQVRCAAKRRIIEQYLAGA
jgi:hypothetical protein